MLPKKDVSLSSSSSKFKFLGELPWLHFMARLTPIPWGVLYYIREFPKVELAWIFGFRESGALGLGDNGALLCEFCSGIGSAPPRTNEGVLLYIAVAAYSSTRALGLAAAWPCIGCTALGDTWPLTIVRSFCCWPVDAYWVDETPACSNSSLIFFIFSLSSAALSIRP